MLLETGYKIYDRRSSVATPGVATLLRPTYKRCYVRRSNAATPDVETDNYPSLHPTSGVRRGDG